MNWEEDAKDNDINRRMDGSHHRNALEIIDDELKSSFFTFAGTQALVGIGEKSINMGIDCDDQEDQANAIMEA